MPVQAADESMSLLRHRQGPQIVVLASPILFHPDLWPVCSRICISNPITAKQFSAFEQISKFAASPREQLLGVSEGRPTLLLFQSSGGMIAVLTQPSEVTSNQRSCIVSLRCRYCWTPTVLPGYCESHCTSHCGSFPDRHRRPKGKQFCLRQY